MGFCLDEENNQLIEDRLGVEVLLRLVDYERAIVAVIKSQIKKQKNNAAGARRQLADVDTVVIDAVSNSDVIRAVTCVRNV